MNSPPKFKDLLTFDIKLQFHGASIIIPVESSAVVTIPKEQVLPSHLRPCLPVLYRMHSTGAHNPKLILINLPQLFSCDTLKNIDFVTPKLAIIPNDSYRQDKFTTQKVNQAPTSLKNFNLKLSNFSIYTTVSDEAKYILEPTSFQAGLEVKNYIEKLDRNRSIFNFNLKGQFQHKLKVYVTSSQVDLLWRLTVSILELIIELYRQVEKEKPVSKADLKRALSRDYSPTKQANSLDSDFSQVSESPENPDAHPDDLASDVSKTSSSDAKPPDEEVDILSNFPSAVQVQVEVLLDSLELCLNELLSQKVQRKIDIFMSNIKLNFEMQKFYSKLNLAIQNLNAMHFKKYLTALNADWMIGEFEGKLINGGEISEDSRENHNLSNLIELKFTRALTEHYLSITEQFFDSNINLVNLGGKEYLHEVICNVLPLQIVLPMEIFKSLESLIQPMLLVKLPTFSKRKKTYKKSSVKGSVPPLNINFDQKRSSGGTFGYNLSSNTQKELENKITFWRKTIQESLTRLPLLYLKIQNFEIFFPLQETQVVNLRLESIELTPEPDNNLERLVFDHQLYNQAEIDGILLIPSSPVEDRQYELKVKNFDMILIDPSNLDRLESLILQPIHFKMVAAPALLDRRTKRMVCGHSFELAIDSDIEISVNYEQILILNEFLKEIVMFTNWVNFLAEQLGSKKDQQLAAEAAKDNPDLKQDPSPKNLPPHLDFIPPPESTRAESENTFDLFTEMTATSGHFSETTRYVDLPTYMFQAYLAPCEIMVNICKSAKIVLENYLQVNIQQINSSLKVLDEEKLEINQHMYDLGLLYNSGETWTPLFETKNGQKDPNLDIFNSLLRAKMTLNSDFLVTLGRPIKDPPPWRGFKTVPTWADF